MSRDRLNVMRERTIFVGRPLAVTKCLRISPLLFMMMGTLAFLAASCSQTAFAQDEAVLGELKKLVVHFDQVTPDVYRSGLIPEEAAPLLKELGVKTVINFDNDDERAQKEAAYLKLFGIYTVWIPWSGWDRPRDQDVEKFLSLMREPRLKPVLVHCKRGSERTGVGIAVWRISEFNWTAAQAYDEMKHYTYRRFLQGHLKRYVYEFARKHGESTARITNGFEQMKTSLFYFFFQLRKLNPFWHRHSRV